MTAAAKFGHLQCLQYLVENDCPVAECIYAYASDAPTMDCLNYLKEKKVPDMW
jgi:hypothetical protein